MSKAEIIAELSRLSPEDLVDVQSNAWQQRGELSDRDKQTFDGALAAYEKSPEAGSSSNTPKD